MFLFESEFFHTLQGTFSRAFCSTGKGVKKGGKAGSAELFRLLELLWSARASLADLVN
jgi:hypothetical protein